MFRLTFQNLTLDDQDLGEMDDVLAGPTGSRPGNITAGTSWFDTTLGYPVWWDGAAWVDADGNPA